jgi:hypothetical protein
MKRMGSESSVSAEDEIHSLISHTIFNHWSYHMLATSNIDYKVKRQTSRHWRSLLSATAGEIQRIESKAELRLLMARIGAKFASQTTMPEDGALGDYEKYMCTVWADMDWGWVELKDGGDTLYITHHCSTNGRLNSNAFGDNSDFWVSSFLEGVYQHWMSRMGASEKLRVKQTSEIDEFGSIEYCLGL